MSFRLYIAGPDDDVEIRGLLARSPVPGRITIAYEREPSYFDGCRTMGPFHQVVVARDEASGALAAVACRTIRRRYVDGEPRDVGYLGQLRVDERYRGRWLISRGFRFLAGLDADGRAASYITTITREGREAQRLLVELKRPHYPAFDRVEEIVTLALLAGRRRRRRGRGVDLAQPGDDAEIAAFFDEHGPRRQYFPTWEPGELAGADVLVARRDGRVVGALAIWDQTAVKQAVVRGYAPALGRYVPLYNAAMRLRGRPVIPPIGAPVRFAFASWVCVAGDDTRVFGALVERALDRAVEHGVDYLMVGLAARDPLLAAARRYAHVEYGSTLYRVEWNRRGGPDGRRDDRIAYVEIATL